MKWRASRTGPDLPGLSQARARTIELYDQGDVRAAVDNLNNAAAPLFQKSLAADQKLVQIQDSVSKQMDDTVTAMASRPSRTCLARSPSTARARSRTVCAPWRRTT